MTPQTFNDLPTGATFRHTLNGPTYVKLSRTRYQLLRHDGTPYPGMTYNCAERCGGTDSVFI